MTADVETAAGRLALALLAGVLIGLEREWRQKNAGSGKAGRSGIRQRFFPRRIPGEKGSKIT